MLFLIELLLNISPIKKSPTMKRFSCIFVISVFCIFFLTNAATAQDSDEKQYQEISHHRHRIRATQTTTIKNILYEAPNNLLKSL